MHRCNPDSSKSPSSSPLPFCFCVVPLNADNVPTRPGYYRFPAIHGDTIIFTAEGDLWSVSIKAATRAASPPTPARNSTPRSPRTEKPSPSPPTTKAPPTSTPCPSTAACPSAAPGTPARVVAGWTPDGRVLYRTRRYSTLPDPKLVAVDTDGRREVFPLSQSAEGAFTPDGKSLFFTRLPWQGSSTKRYKGGTAENIWRYDTGAEAVPLTSDYAGTSHNPMFWNGRVYFLSDRDGIMNIFSMDPQGHDLKQVTHQSGFDVESASLSDGRIVYACGCRSLAARSQLRPRRHHPHHARLRLRPAARPLGQEAARISHQRRTFRPTAAPPSSPRAAKSSPCPPRPAAAS